MTTSQLKDTGWSGGHDDFPSMVKQLLKENAVYHKDCKVSFSDFHVKRLKDSYILKVFHCCSSLQLNIIIVINGNCELDIPKDVCYFNNF